VIKQDILSSICHLRDTGVNVYLGVQRKAEKARPKLLSIILYI
jgi:hypothetical protein